VKIFLDDERVPVKPGWTIVRNFNEFRDTVLDNAEIITEITFDHDLGDDFRNGFNCVDWMTGIALDYPGVFSSLKRIWFHSANTEGIENMRGRLEGMIEHGVIHNIELIDYSCLFHKDHAIMPTDFDETTRK
jgi:hypothetical protein